MINEAVPEPGTPPLSTTQQANDQKKTVAEGGSSGSTSIGSNENERRFARLRSHGFARTVWKFVTWTPKRCRWDPEDPPKFSMGLNLLFGFVSFFFLTHPVF
jgi:hypothetical protein